MRNIFVSIARLLLLVLLAMLWPFVLIIFCGAVLAHRSHIRDKKKLGDNKQGETGLVCVKCGSEGTKGSAKHPYCEKCFWEVWHNDYEAYFKFLRETHYK